MRVRINNNNNSIAFTLFMQGTIQLPHHSLNKQLLEKSESSLEFLFPDTSSDAITLNFSEETVGGFKRCSISSEVSSTNIRLLSKIPVLLTGQVSAAHGPFLKIYILPEDDARIKKRIIEPGLGPRKLSSLFQQQNGVHSDLLVGSADRNQESRKTPKQQHYNLPDIDSLTHSLSFLSIALENLRKDNKASINRHIIVTVPKTTSQNTIAQDSHVAQRNKMHAAARNLHHKASLYEKRSSMFEESSPRYCYWKHLSDTARHQAMLLQSLLIRADSSSGSI